MRYLSGFATAATFLLALLIGTPASAHCDGMDGPVITEAKAAIEAGDVTPILKWIPADDEHEIRELFDKTLAVRELSPEAREIADRHFYETLVRIHRASEGVAFTGILPSGTPVAPGVARADAVLESGNADDLADEIAQAVRESIHEQFNAAVAAQSRKDQSVEAGREYVAEYVNFVHYVKHLHECVSKSEGHGHVTADEDHAADDHAH